MMKDYANPLLLLVVLGLLACRSAAEAADVHHRLDMWILGLCVTGLLVDGALALAKGMTRRPPLMNVVWAVTFLMLGCCAWMMHATPLTEEQLTYMEQKKKAPDPLARDAEGETLLTRAAALGKVQDVQQILNTANPPEDMLSEAGLRAAENNKTAVLDILARLGLSAEAKVHGVPLLHAAAQNGACEAMEWLLKRGAHANGRDDEDGSTPLIQATIADNLAAVNLLLKYGADVRLRDTGGMSAADYARSEEIRTRLSAPPAPSPSKA